ncbi:MAG TPA: zinc ribbon domain-containing protein [Dehalococcoidia bacterium]|jgi:putative FmdB family regulatory protein|nr:zinc ribbon domain-containing protein [Dehalococcoidia bacterium]
MPLYDFRCRKCGLEFEVSRPLARATDPAYCPMDSEESERIFTMPNTFVKNRSSDEVPKPPQEQSGGGGWSHFGHSHGAGSGGHSHGP